ncbi:hypothetical protein ACS0TY_006529 [Phlomoides rotata]
MGDGSNTVFWRDNWAGGRALKERFKRLFLLSLDKEKSVREMGIWREGVWEWKWRWRRDLRDCESLMLNELISVVNLHIPKQDVADKWRWRAGPKGVYSTKAAYEFLIERKAGPSNLNLDAFSLIWNKMALPKVRVHAWRILWERLPTTTKLQQRSSLPPGANINCAFCDASPESVRHVFFECPFVYMFWMDCLNWLGVKTALSSSPSINLLHFSRFFRGNLGKDFAVCVWECVVWLIWKARNAIIFKGEQLGNLKLLEEQKFRLWSWLSVKYQRISNWSFEEWNKAPVKLIYEI